MNQERFDEVARGLATNRITRWQALKGLGAGAVTLSAGTLRACCACDPGAAECDVGDETTVERTGEVTNGGTSDPQVIVRDEMGDKAASYVGRQVTDPVVFDYIDARAASFGSACNLGGVPGGLGLTVLSSGDLPVLDIGGEFTNDQSFSAYIDLEASPAFVKYFSEVTGHEVKKGSTFAYFVTNRFFDAKVSIENNRPLVGIVDAVFVIATDSAEGGSPSTVEIHQVDCGGVRRLRKVRINQDDHPPTDAIDKNENIVGREARVNAYFGYLVGEFNGEKGLLPYDPFNFENPLSPDAPQRKSYAGIQGVQYQGLDPHVPHDQWGEPSAPNDTGGIENMTGVYRDDEAAFFTVQVAGYGLSISKPQPQPSPLGYGDPANIGFGSFACHSWSELDGCKTCCSDAGLLALGTIAASVGTCIALTWTSPPCWIIPFIGNVSCTVACAAAGAVLALATRYKETTCDSNCYTRVPL